MEVKSRASKTFQIEMKINSAINKANLNFIKVLFLRISMSWRMGLVIALLSVSLLSEKLDSFVRRTEFSFFFATSHLISS